MKRIVLVLSLFVAASINAQITKVATSTFGSQAGSNTTTCVSGSINASTAELLVGFVKWEGGTDASNTVTDTGSNTWNEIARINHADSAVNGVLYYSVPSSVSSTHTFSYTPSVARTDKHCALAAISGNFNISNALNDFTSAISAVDSTSVDAGTIDTTAAAIIVQWNVNAFGEALAPGGSFQAGDEDRETAGRQIQSRIEATSVSGFDPVATATNAIGWGAIAAAFVEDGGGGGGGGLLLRRRRN